MLRRTEAAIVGGGIIGLATACALRKKGLSVAVIDPAPPGQEASAKAAGMLCAHAGPGGLTPFTALCYESRQLYPAFVKEIEEATGISVELDERGLFLVALNDDDEQKLEKKWEWQSEAGIPCERLGQRELVSEEPSLSPELRWGIHFKADGALDNVRLMQALEVYARSLGVHFLLYRPVIGILHEKERVTGVVLTNGRLLAKWVILSAGAWSNLDRALPFPVPVKPAKGQIVVLAGEGCLIRRPLHWRSIYLVPRRDGRVLIGSTVEFVGFNRALTAKGIHKLLSGALAMCPDLSRLQFQEAWAGLRPCSEDRWPILGPTPIHGLLMATGHFRSGILLAPVTAKLLTEFITEGKTSFPLEPFSVTRFMKRQSQEKVLAYEKAVPIEDEEAI